MAIPRRDLTYTVKLHPSTERKLDELIRALNANSKQATKTVKRRLTEPLDGGEGDWTLNGEDEVGND